MTSLNKRLSTIEASPTLALNAKLKSLQQSGKSIINLTVGEPDFHTPDHIKQAAIDAIHQNQTRYTPVDGTHQLKEAIQSAIKQTHSLHYEANQLIVTSGAKFGIYLLCQALLNPGDEAIIPAPYWVSYPPIVQLAGAKPVIISTTIDQRFKMTPAQLEKTITPKTKLLFLNSPSNPSGQCYSNRELNALAEVLKRHPDIFIMSDDIYEKIVFENPASHLLTLCPELYDRTIIINGVSKSHCMTGWRIGYAAGPEKVINGMKRIASQSTSNPCSIAQAATIAALTGSQEITKTITDVFKARHDAWINAMTSVSGFTMIASEGTFYNFMDVTHAISSIKNIHNDIELCDYLIEHADIGLMPGSPFGMPNHLRVSFTVPEEKLIEAAEKIKKLIA